MIYLPKTDYPCYVIRDKDTIRAYHTTPTTNSTINYTDYYINSHYLENNGNQTFSQYTSLPTCIDKSLITDLPYYRNDISDILITFTFMLLAIGIPLYIALKGLFRGWFR